MVFGFSNNVLNHFVDATTSGYYTDRMFFFDPLKMVSDL